MRNRKIKNTLLALVIAFGFAAGLTGCGDQKQEEATTEAISVTAKEVLDQSMKAMDQIDQLAMRAGYLLDTTATILDTAVPFKIEQNAQMQVDAKGNRYVEASGYTEYSGQKTEQNTKQYVILNGTKAESYYCVDGEWGFEIFESAEDDNPIDSQRNLLRKLQESSDKITVDAVEETEAKSCYRLTGTVGSEFLDDALDAAGTDNGDLDQFTEALKDQTIPVSLWVDKKEMIPVKLVLDLSAVMERAMNEATKDQGITYAMNKMEVSFVYTGFAVSEVVVPAEALEAAK